MTFVDLLPFAAIAAVFWLLIIRPASARRKAQARLIASLAPGQRIMTTAGVFGTLVARKGERISLEIAPGVVIEMVAMAVAEVVPADSAAQPQSAPELAVPESDRAEPESDLAEPESDDLAEPASDHEEAADLEGASDPKPAPEPQAASELESRSELKAASELQARSEAEQAADRG